MPSRSELVAPGISATATVLGWSIAPAAASDRTDQIDQTDLSDPVRRQPAQVRDNRKSRRATSPAALVWQFLRALLTPSDNCGKLHLKTMSQMVER
jgi:hypothetical protein